MWTDHLGFKKGQCDIKNDVIAEYILSFPVTQKRADAISAVLERNKIISYTQLPCLEVVI